MKEMEDTCRNRPGPTDTGLHSHLRSLSTMALYLLDLRLDFLAFRETSAKQ